MPHLWEERPGESHRRFLQVCYKEPRIPMSWPRERTAIKLLDTQNLKLGKDLGCYPCTLLHHCRNPPIHPAIHTYLGIQKGTAEVPALLETHT